MTDGGGSEPSRTVGHGAAPPGTPPGPSVVNPPPSAASPRRLAATPGTTECPRAALYIIPALPNVRDAAVFQLVRSTYIDTVKRLAPAGASRGILAGRGC